MTECHYKRKPNALSKLYLIVFLNSRLYVNRTPDTYLMPASMFNYGTYMYISLELYQ